MSGGGRVGSPRSQSADGRGIIRKIDKFNFNIEFKHLQDIIPVTKGNYGAIYAAQYGSNKVALKRMTNLEDEKSHKYYIREINTLKNIMHKNIVKYFGLCKHSSGVYIVTEYINGGDLHTLLSSKVELSWTRRIKIAIEVAEAFEYIHSKNLVHRDLKSQNILITKTFEVKVCDFGFARQISSIPKLNRELSTCGTEAWMAPEVMTSPVYNEKVDVFSYGMLLIELLIRDKPPSRSEEDNYKFNFENFVNHLKDYLHNNEDEVASIPDTYLQLISMTTNANYRERPPFSEIVMTLTSILKSLPPSIEEEKVNHSTKKIEGAIRSWLGYSHPPHSESDDSSNSDISDTQSDSGGNEAEKRGSGGYNNEGEEEDIRQLIVACRKTSRVAPLFQNERNYIKRNKRVTWNDNDNFYSSPLSSSLSVGGDVECEEFEYDGYGVILRNFSVAFEDNDNITIFPHHLTPALYSSYFPPLDDEVNIVDNNNNNNNNNSNNNNNNPKHLFLNFTKGKKVLISQYDSNDFCEVEKHHVKVWVPSCYLRLSSNSKRKLLVDESSITNFDTKCHTNANLLRFFSSRPSPADLSNRGIIVQSNDDQKLDKRRKIDYLTTFFKPSLHYTK